MPDAFSHCADLIRMLDRDRFIASLFAPVEHRGALHALYAFNDEVDRVRERARSPLPGEIRLQWWTDVVNRERDGEAAANPVAAALLATIERYDLSSIKLADLIAAHRFDLYDDPLLEVADFERYAASTSSALFALATQVLSGLEAEAQSRAAGIAYTVLGVLRDFPVQAARRQLFVPNRILDRHQVRLHDVFAGRSSTGLRPALMELGELGRGHLDVLRAQVPLLPPAALPALLPVAIVRPSLDRLDRGDPFAPAELARWRRQWLIWRAARNPARIAG